MDLNGKTVHNFVHDSVTGGGQDAPRCGRRTSSWEDAVELSAALT